MKYVLLALCCIFTTFNTLAHEGHGPNPSELKQQAEEGKICIADNHGHSLGAYIEHNGKIFRCVKVWTADLVEQRELMWVELVLKDEKLITMP